MQHLHQVLSSTSPAGMQDVVFVVNSGRLKEKSHDPYTGVSTLQSQFTSKASEQQRRGRAGRCRPGLCFHLYSRQRSVDLAVLIQIALYLGQAQVRLAAGTAVYQSQHIECRRVVSQTPTQPNTIICMYILIGRSALMLLSSKVCTCRSSSSPS